MYSSLEQRMAQAWIDLLPAFVPEEDAPVSVAEQQVLYDLMRCLYQLAFDEPLLLVPALHEDDAYPTRFKKAYGKPQLILNMHRFTKALGTLLQRMFVWGQGGDAQLSKRERTMLARLGIAEGGCLPAAWTWMATREGAGVIAFQYCLFRQHFAYAPGIYARLLGDSQAYRKLEGWMLDNGYRAYDMGDITASECKLSLAIANPAWGEAPPRGGYEYQVRHTGIAVMYDFYVQNPVVLGLCIPHGLKQFLEAFDTMDDALQRFVVERTKKCDHCRYCVQTDKRGTRPLACLPVRFEGVDYALCPYFPGYHYAWPSLDDDLADKLIGMLAFMDRFAPQAAATRAGTPKNTGGTTC